MDSVKYIGNAADANSGIYHINEVNAGIKDGSWPTNYKIENSLRFNGTSSYLSRTFGTPTDNNNYTYSCWFKLSNLSSDMQFFASRPTSTPYTLFYYQSSSQIIEFADSSVTTQYSWNHKIRDVSSWYHLVLSVSATGTDRLKLYINNVLNTKSAGTDPNNNSTLLNSAVAHTVGSGMPSTTNYFNGYLANIQFIDGQALDPSYFATTHPVTGRWVPKPYRGTYGTNGFHLDFSNKNSGTGVGTIGEDKSGNGNHWTTNNLDHSDVVPDSPTNNFATMSSIAPAGLISGGVLSEGNLRVSTTGTAGCNVPSTMPIVDGSGKYYVEQLVNYTTDMAGILTRWNGGNSFTSPNSVHYSVSGGIVVNGTNVHNGLAVLPVLTSDTPKVLGMSIDTYTRQVTYYVDGVQQATAVTYTHTDDLFFAIHDGSSNTIYNTDIIMNFGQDPTFSGAKVPSKVYTDSNNQGRFFYQPPEGALALCEANLNQPEITPNQYPIDETNQHRLTYNGNVQQSKFTPYAPDGYSINFDGSSELLYTNTNIYTLNLFDWMDENNAETDKIGTIEAWIYLQDFSTGTAGSGQYTDRCILGRGATFLNFGVRRDGKLRFYMYNSKNQYWTETDNTVISLRRWHHVAVSTYYDSNAGFAKVRMFIDGIEKNSTSYDDGVSQGNNRFWGSDFTNTTSGYENIYIGREGSEPATSRWIGYIKDLRVTKESLYTTNFSVPTSNLQKLTNTVLLIGNSKSLNDASDNAFIFSPVGQPSISDWSPYTPELVRKGVHFRRPEDYGGGSFYFDGTNNLKTIDSTDWNPDAGDFTIEGWYYLTETGNFYFLWGTGGSDGNEDFAMRVNIDNTINAYLRNSDGTLVGLPSTNTVSKNSWNHIALERYNNVIKIYLNGVAETNTFDATSWSGYNSETGMTIGAFGNYSLGGYWKGYIADFRFVKGSAVYQGNFTPPTAKLSTVTDTKLLLQPWQTATTRGVFTIPDTYKQDEGDRNLYYDNGGVSITTASPYKSSSVGSFMFDGSNNSQNGPLKLPKDEFPFYNVGINDFTMEWWFKMIVNNGTGASSYQGIFWGGSSSQSTDDPHVAVNNSTIQIYLASNWQNTGFTPATGVWYHFALVRDYAGNSIKMFINGKQEFSTTTGAQNNYDQWNNSSTLQNNCHFGNHGGYSAFEGLITDIRFVKNQALYTTNFTPPSYPLLDNKFSITGENPSEGSAITGTVMLFTQPGTGFTKNSAAQNPKKYFNTLLYTGNGGTQSITGLDFKPDLVWIKDRDSTYYHRIFDTVRGVTKEIFPNGTDAENTTSGSLTAFNPDGFTLGSNGATNLSGNSFVAWCFRAGGNSNTFNINGTGYGTYNELQTANTSLPASSTSGMIVPSGMSINTDAGFSIVKYIGTGSTGGIVPHGLNKKPDMVIIKNLDDGARSWNITSFITTPSTVLTANTFNIGSKTGGVLGLNYSNGGGAYTIDGQTSGSGQNHIAYCWHSVPGYSAFGSYEGNQNANGPFVYTGFRPAFVLTKTIDFTENWTISDSARSPNNPVDLFLRPDEPAGDTSSAATMDFLSNGFKLRTGDTKTNVSSTIIYMAFAEQPFTKTTAR